MEHNLICRTTTKQEKAACRYLDEIGKNKEFDKYKNIAVTGHSLGGNLAQVATVYTATDDCTTNMSSRIKQSVNMDGPGQTKEFIEKYSKAIVKMQEKMIHYQWSPVGAIFTSLCMGDNYVHVDSSKFHLDTIEYLKYLQKLKDEGASELKINIMAGREFFNELPSFFNKHSTTSLDFDEDGNMKETNTFDIVSKVINDVTNAIDENNPVQEYVAAMANIISDTAVNLIDSTKHIMETTPYNIECAKEYATAWSMQMLSTVDMIINQPEHDKGKWILFLTEQAMCFSKMATSANELRKS